MKSSIKSLLLASLIFTTSPTVLAQEPAVTQQQASFIPMTAATDKADDFAKFLTGAAPLVKQTEPGTLLWFALQGVSEDELAIFDIFKDEAARDAHFAGAVAGALKDNANTLVAGGWNDGVVNKVRGAQVLSIKAPLSQQDAKTATYIAIKAAPGQEESLAELLSAAGPIVSETEPKTLYWVAIRLDKSNFAIFDTFADESGREAHFAGQVAGLLKQKSAQLVAGGWEDGVVANVSNYKILASK